MTWQDVIAKVRKPNRIAARTPTRSKWWCGCDMAKIGHAGKCPKCGHSYKGSKEKRAHHVA